MATFSGIDLGYTPLPISNDEINSIANSTPTTQDEDIAIADKLVSHLNLIKDFQNRLDAIDYLSANAIGLAGNPTYTTNDPRLISCIKDLGDSGNQVDFLLFQKVVDVVIDGYKNMALTSLTGVNNI